MMNDDTADKIIGPPKISSLNSVQKAAYELIQSDARFLYTLTVIQREAKNINSNYMMMSQPYIGLFADGAEQWCKKVGFGAPEFNIAEKKYYSELRSGHKLYELAYSEYLTRLIDKLNISDRYFYQIRNLRAMVMGYYNVGTDLCNGQYCGNTILCALYSPVDTLNVKDIGPYIRDISVVAGKLAGFFYCDRFPPYEFNDSITVKYKDYHFFKNCPLTMKSELGFVLFSVLCSINYATKFIDKYFVEEIPQKLKFAYLQYYYICDFINELNAVNGTDLYINNSLKDRKFRNCLAHYGLGQYLSENDVINNDILKGITYKAFSMDYWETKDKIFSYLTELTKQIETKIFSTAIPIPETKRSV